LASIVTLVDTSPDIYDKHLHAGCHRHAKAERIHSLRRSYKVNLTGLLTFAGAAQVAIE